MTFAIMTVAAHTGSSPQEIREEWTWADVQEFLICLPGIRRYGLGGDW